MKHPVPTKLTTIVSIKVELCNALLRILMVRVRSYLKSVLRYKFLILGAYHPDNVYKREQVCEDPWLFYEAKRGPREKKCLRNAILYDSLNKVAKIYARNLGFVIFC
jgi:hypothetical protein